MANVELDDTIKDKLKDAFGVDNSEIERMLNLFNKAGYKKALSFTSCCKYRGNNQR